MSRPLSRLRLAALAVAIPLVLFGQSRANGQEPALEVRYTKLEPREQFQYKWKGKEAVANAGVFRWEVPESEFGTHGLDRNFTGYCAEVLVPIIADKLYRFRVNSIYAVENYGLTEHPNGPIAAERRARSIQELFGRYYRDPLARTMNSEDAVALQVALWEVIQETEPAEGAPKLDLFAGDFQANYPRADAPAFVLRAQQYLDSLTGNDALFYENPDLKGRELIRLMGIENAEKVVAQSQFALRYAGGGGAGAGTLNRALTAGGGVGGVGGSGAPVGGVGGGAGGGGLFTNPNGGSTFPAVTPNTTTPGGGTTTTTTPPTTTTSTPPVGGPETPTNPIPAPAGLILGVIALGTIGSWRLGVRLLASK
jgi:hypothetical protein